MLPTFVSVGPGRTGTTWLYEVLLEHPEIVLAEGIKETEFFDLNYDKGVAWYERFFRSASKYKAVGEITNRYIFDDQVPNRIKMLIPDCKIIIGLRNPYERIQSNYTFKLREGAYSGSFANALKDMPELVSENLYSLLINPYIKYFGRENVFLLLFDDIKDRPEELCRSLFDFLGVSVDFVPSMTRKKINQAIVPRYPWAAYLTKRVARTLRKLGLYNLLTMAKRSSLAKSLLFKPYDYGQKQLLTPSVRKSLDPVFQPEIDRLEFLLSRKLDSWR